MEAEYPGSDKAWINYLNKNFRYPEIAIKIEIQGTVLSRFVGRTYGSIIDFKIIESPDTLLSNDATRIIQDYGKWEPATQNGKKIKSFKTQPVIGKLESRKS